MLVPKVSFIKRFHSSSMFTLVSAGFIGCAGLTAAGLGAGVCFTGAGGSALALNGGLAAAGGSGLVPARERGEQSHNVALLGKAKTH